MSLPEIKTILYTTSLSKHTRPVFRQAVKMAELYNAKLVMLHVVEPIGETGQALIQNYLAPELIKNMHDEGLAKVKDNMKDRVKKFYDDEMQDLEVHPDITIEQIVGEGNRSDEIVEVANEIDADMILMGSHNSLGRSSRTTRQVIKYAKRPVMVIPVKG
ncbi:universal stress protein [Motiliproteus coralliicola]|uniref:Universal stress protein n=1 Tax=Motiliproteus coralliicola TaxID=2283196 RepID=A0A369WH15_9GAMM|nr:universal stress protein [Motiliproteus coralliicola]RDE19906.1 universal stress protein [Motiliproteus coralliicola]